jgi:RimJ/RimL family protein N-acetyltransferase
VDQDDRPRQAAPDVVAGSVTLWSHDEDSEPVTEIGWMVLPEFQGRGLAKRAVRMLLELARDDGRWGLVHAFPATANSPSNGICRSLGFRFAGERDVTCHTATSGGTGGRLGPQAKGTCQ